MGYVLAIFKFFLSALRSIKEYGNPFSLCILTFWPYGRNRIQYYSITATIFPTTVLRKTCTHVYNRFISRRIVVSKLTILLEKQSRLVPKCSCCGHPSLFYNFISFISIQAGPKYLGYLIHAAQVVWFFVHIFLGKWAMFWLFSNFS